MRLMECCSKKDYPQNSGGVVLSIVIPTWNRAALISELIASIVRQVENHACEIIVVDDGSIDETDKVVLRYQDSSRCSIRILRQKLHRGAAAARNVGLSAAAGAYVWFVDSDDLIVQGALDRIFRWLKEYKPDILRFSRIKSFSRKDDAAVLGKERALPVCYDLKNSVRGLMLFLASGSIWNGVFSHKLIAGVRFDENFYYGEDALFTWEATLNASKGVYVDEAYYVYRFTENSLTTDVNCCRFGCYMHQVERFLELIDNSCVDMGVRDRLYSECYFRVYSHAFGCFNAKDISREMWEVWRQVHRHVLVENRRRCWSARMLSGCNSCIASPRIAFAIFWAWKILKQLHRTIESRHTKV